jgi:hypothetical protein
MRVVQAILCLPDEHDAEAGMLVRVLYDHITLLAWLATDPATNLQQWFREDLDQRIRTDNDLRQLGLGGLDDATRGQFVAERDAIPRQWPGLAGFAHQADQHWSQRLKAFEDQTLRKLYVGVFRQFSPLVHGMIESMMRISRIVTTCSASS